MRSTRSHPVSPSIPALAAFLLLATLAIAQENPRATTEPAYVRRGDQVDIHYGRFRERLERDYEVLEPRVRTEAPDLYGRFRAASPGAIPYGYQLVPPVVPDLPASGRPLRSVSTAFSWSRTDALIEASERKLDRLWQRVRQADAIPAEARQAEWEQIVGDYVGLVKSHRLINNQIQYNRLWQREIASGKATYDRLTALHDMVVERQAILDELAAGHEIDPKRRARDQEILAAIRQRTEALGSLPASAAIERPEPGQWTIRVPVYTDIQDASFLDRFRTAVENRWRVDDGNQAFRVVVDMRYIPSERLYADRPGPVRGEHIDLAAHDARFPPGGAVLTTGAGSTHVLGHSINLGPHDVAPNTLAHEFGHLLGFTDGYFRGYRDLGPDGYEVLEIVTDPVDLMSAPGYGAVSRRHFSRILAQWSETSLMKTGLEALYGRQDPESAAVQFRQILETNPTHYGATYQLAAALDKAGRPEEARLFWERVLEMAQRYDDAAVANRARMRLKGDR